MGDTNAAEVDMFETVLFIGEVVDDGESGPDSGNSGS